MHSYCVPPLFHVFCVLALFSISVPASSDMGSWQSKEQKLFIDAVKHSDIKKLSAALSADTQFLLQSIPTIQGKDDVVNYFKTLFERQQIIDFNKRQIGKIELHDKSIIVGEYTLLLEIKYDQTVEIKGSFLSIWQHQDQGRMSLQSELWNFDQDPSFANKLQFDQIDTKVTALQAHLAIDTPATLELAAYSSLIKEAVLVRDPVVLSELYSDDGIILRNSNAPIVGKEAIRRYWRHHINEIAGMEGLQQRTTAIEEIGNVIIQHSSHIAIWRAGKHSGVNTGKHIRIWERQADGRLQIRILASAYDS